VSGVHRGGRRAGAGVAQVRPLVDATPHQRTATRSTLRPHDHRLSPPGSLRGRGLAAARVGTFTDAEELWAAEGGVAVDGFDYQTIGDTRITDTRQRLYLLEQATGDYAPGPYEQLAAAYRRAGHEDLAERVLMTRQIRRYREAGPAGRVWGGLQRWTVGFGYQPWLAVCWLVLAWLLGGLWFMGHVPIPVDDGQHPVFDAWIFAADTLLPIVNPGQVPAPGGRVAVDRHRTDGRGFWPRRLRRVLRGSSNGCSRATRTS
jgi:hypothetical protein